MMKWVYAYAISEPRRKIRFTKHRSRYNAEKAYGDLSRHYRGGAGSDYCLTIYEGREEMEKDLADGYGIDWENQIITEK